MQIIMYGIKNCDTMKKAIKWLNETDIPFLFHDYKKSGIGDKELRQWHAHHDLDTLINKRGTTWRKLSDTEKQVIENGELTDEAIQLIQQNSSMIKRPILNVDGKIQVGFNDQAYTSLFG